MNETDKWKLIFGFSLLFLLSMLAFAIALGKVHEESSHGLVQVLTILGVLGGSFANWAFGTTTKDKKDEDAD